jgi:hypothetical protein
MPLINYKCENQECGAVFQKLYKKASDAPMALECKICKNNSKKLLSAPSSFSKMVIDQGVGRAVELFPDVMEVREQHSKAGHNRGD